MKTYKITALAVLGSLTMTGCEERPNSPEVKLTDPIITDATRSRVCHLAVNKAEATQTPIDLSPEEMEVCLKIIESEASLKEADSRQH